MITKKQIEMANAKHTSGKWKIQTILAVPRQILAPDGEVICEFNLSDNGADPYNADSRVIDANAKLIAAAPELLEAARECMVSAYAMQSRSSDEMIEIAMYLERTLEEVIKLATDV